MTHAIPRSKSKSFLKVGPIAKLLLLIGILTLVLPLLPKPPPCGHLDEPALYQALKDILDGPLKDLYSEGTLADIAGKMQISDRFDPRVWAASQAIAFVKQTLRELRNGECWEIEDKEIQPLLDRIMLIH